MLKNDMNILGLKVDVDTYEGMKKGVPRLLEILDKFGIKATFYLSIGPDASGRAIFQIIRNPGFLKKMIKTNAPGLYGFKTAMYGTILPSPMIAKSFPDIVRKIIKNGHEVQFHAWDHRRWQDDMPKRSKVWIKNWFENGINGFKDLTDRLPSSFGAPAWLIDDRVIKIIKDYDFKYLSCTRAESSFIHEKILIKEIPSDLPCFEETGIQKGVSVIASLLKKGGIHVLPVHAEVEGGIWGNYFIQLLGDIKTLGYKVITLSEIDDLIPSKSLTIRKHHLKLIDGRSSPCAV